MQQGWHNTVMKGMNMDELWCLLLLEDVVSTEWHWSGWMLAVGPWWRLSMAVLHSFNFSPCCVKTESIHSRTMPEEIVKAILAGRYSVKRCDFPALVSLLTTESTHRKRQHATDFYGVSWYDLWWCVFFMLECIRHHPSSLFWTSWQLGCATCLGLMILHT